MESPPEVDGWFLRADGDVVDVADEDRVITAVVPGVCRAVQHHCCVGEDGNPLDTDFEAGVAELVRTASGKLHGEVTVVGVDHVNHPSIRVEERGMALRAFCQAHEHERRVS
jgi:hypothetical protein